MEVNEYSYLYAEPTLSFLRIATEFCRQLEQCQTEEPSHFQHVMRGLLLALYQHMDLLSAAVPEMPGYTTPQVTEDDYNYVRSLAAEAMGTSDTFLAPRTFNACQTEDASLTASEILADIYQILRDLVEHFRRGGEEEMATALWEARSEFSLSWGRKALLAALVLHDAEHSL